MRSEGTELVGVETVSTVPSPGVVASESVSGGTGRSTAWRRRGLGGGTNGGGRWPSGGRTGGGAATGTGGGTGGASIGSSIDSVAGTG